ncbi:MAG: intracellular growth attenuator family protein [Chloroflexi bacterium]|nr:intracellular growth attenuator family protein [Chloroflexota bacterium]
MKSSNANIQKRVIRVSFKPKVRQTAPQRLPSAGKWTHMPGADAVTAAETLAKIGPLPTHGRRGFRPGSPTEPEPDLTAEADKVLAESLALEKRLASRTRALNSSMLSERISAAFSRMVEARTLSYGAMVTDLYHEGNETFLIVSDRGRLYRIKVMVGTDDVVTLAQPMEVTEAYTPLSRQQAVNRMSYMFRRNPFTGGEK